MSDEEGYRSICSQLTLQSERKGFFQEFADTVTELVGKKWLEKFSKLATDSERLVTCFTDKKTNEIVEGMLDNIQKLYRTKSGKLAMQRRQEAEHLLYNGKCRRGVLIANQGVARAPRPGLDHAVDGGYTLPLCLYARAGLFFEMGKYDMALLDVQLALRHSLPDKMKPEAYLRMAECYLELGEKNKAQVALGLVGKMAVEPSSKDVLEKSQSLLLNLDKEVKPPPEVLKKEEPELAGGANPSFPNASSSIDCVRTKEAGRTMIAKNRISPGDLLVRERPFAACLFVQKYGTHCLHCFNRIERIVPCPDCSGVAYCSSQCEQLGTRYHRYECAHSELMIGSGMSASCHLALRIVSQERLEYFRALRAHLEDPAFSHPYMSIYRLESHVEKRSAKDLLHRTLMAHFLLRILRDSGYFGKDFVGRKGVLTEDEVLIGSLLCRHIQSLQYNAHEVYETLMKTRLSYRASKTHNIGLAVYPTVAMFNHECCPAVTRYFQGNTILIRSVRSSLPGQIVSENYGPVFSVMDRDSRQRSLAGRYLFKCDCVACQQDWPKLDDISDLVFRCTSGGCHGRLQQSQGPEEQECRQCKRPVRVSELCQLYRSYVGDFEAAVSVLDSGRLQEAEALMAGFLARIEKLVFPPERHLTLAQEGLRTVWADSGNTFVLP